MPAKLVILLDRSRTPDGPSFRVALWADVPVPKQPFYAGQPPSVWRGASVAENQAITAGQVRERVSVFTPQAGATIAQIQAQLIEHQSQWQAAVTTDPVFSRYGMFFDGLTWTLGGA